MLFKKKKGRCADFFSLWPVPFRVILQLRPNGSPELRLERRFEQDGADDLFQELKMTN